MTIKSKQKITIIYPPSIDYSLLYQRPQQLLKAFSKIQNVRCVFISSESYKRLDKQINEVSKDMFVVSRNSDYKHLIQGKVVFWNSYPAHVDYPLQAKKDFVVFDALDNPVGEFAEWKNKLDYAVNKSNIISCTAKILYDYHKEKSNKPLFMCPNGGDFTHFKKAKKRMDRPIDFPKFVSDEKVVGFYGAMASWLDTDIVKKIADKYKVVLIGNNKFYSLNVLHPNVTLIDHKDYLQLPQYLSQFDVAMIPFKLTEMMKGCDPVKLQEYLASGKPVVTTRIEDVVANFSDVVDFMDIDNCIEVIDNAISNNTKEKEEARIRTSINNSWDVRAETAIEMINKYLN